ncbi:MAG: alpha-L-glutamate ligase [Alphaproteobacteria bacterium]|nr:alpha-L-glutamate ligase [Alphaproteobacteria bacterium]
MSTVHILFENEAWMAPLRDALARRGLPVEEHFVEGGTLDLASTPPEGVWINRMSPSSHTRGHQGGVAFVKEYLHHLEAHGRRVINGSRAFALEVSKVRQDLALRRAGIQTPHTIAVIGGPAALKAAARTLALPFITKHNQGGKGLGVQLFRDLDAFDAHVDAPGFEDGIDGVTLLQQYIPPAGGYITRVEIVDGVFQYAIRSSTAGGFELCPADACAIDDAYCPVGESATFALRPEITADDPLVRSYVRLMRDEQLDLAGIEFVEDAEGQRYTYDINGTTNYNGTVEAEHGLSGMDALAALVERELRGSREAAAK